MIGRRRGYLRRSVLLLLAIGLVGGFGYVLSISAELKDSELVAKARAMRLGDPDHGVPGSPSAAIDLLERIIDRSPEKYDAHVEMAEAWRDLAAWDKAVASLAVAAECAADDAERIRAMRLARVYLTHAGRYDEAVEMARAIVEIQPHLPLHRLHVGLALYSASVAKKQDIIAQFRVMALDNEGTAIGDRLEAYITDLWGTPDPEPIVTALVKEGDVVAARTLTEQLASTREAFLQAAEILSGYASFPGFDQSVASAYVELLLRSGRIYDAHIEAGMALQERGLAAGVRQQFLESQADCSLAIGDHGQAADAFATLVAEFDEAGLWIPSRFMHTAYEARIAAGHWDWILANVKVDAERYRGAGDRLWLDYAEAAARYATGDVTRALELIRSPFTTVALGTMSSRPPCVRFFPERRREVLLLAYRLFAATDDRRRLDALDAVIKEAPLDPEARRLRLAEHLAAGRIEPALHDALELLKRPERDRADFDHWLEIADQLSRARREGLGLARRAAAIVDDAEEWRTKRGKARFVRHQARTAQVSTVADSPIQLHWPQDPALSYTIVRELIDRGHFKTARNELRKLTEILPDVHEFRFQLGRLLVREGLLESASKTFRELLERIPSDAEVLDLAMRTDDALGRHGDASDLLKRMILEDPLGVGAVRYAGKLVDEGKAQAAQNLVRRLMRWEDLSDRPDVLTVAARAALALGDYATAEAVVDNLYQRLPESVDLALVALELGFARDAPGLVDSAVERLRPLATSLFPDQLTWLMGRLLEAGLYEELLTSFGPQVRALPAARPALRSIVRAAIAVGDLEQASEYLQLVDDEHALLDRFLLMALSGDIDLAGRELLLETVRPGLRDVVELCQLTRSGMLGFRTLQDVTPVKRLGALQLGGLLPPRELELFDALLRLAPSVRRLDEVLPKAVVADPRAVYRHAAPDVAAVVEAARADPARAERAIHLALAMLLTGERPFWERERAFLAGEMAALVPAMTLPRQILIEQALEEDRPDDALELLRPLIDVPPELRAHGLPDVRSMRLFLETTHRLDRAEWGTALAYQLADLAGRDDVRILLADTLRDWGRPEESLEYYTAYLAEYPHDHAALAGIVQALVLLRRYEEVVPWARQALDAQPDDELLAVCADALAAHHAPSVRATVLMDEMYAKHPTLFQLGAALARARAGKPERVAETLRQLIDGLQRHPVERDSEAERARSNILVHASATARSEGLIDLARELNTMALRLDAGEKNRFQELAFIELAEGRLERARRYLEALNVVDIADKQSAQALAELYFTQLGKPIDAAEIVRRTFTVQPPPWAVTILAAEDYLLGRPEEAITRYRAVERSPLLDDDTFYTVAKIAYASGNLELARDVIQYVLFKGDKQHPVYPRAEWLFQQRLAPAFPDAGQGEPETAAAAPGAPDGPPTALAASRSGAPDAAAETVADAGPPAPPADP